jgi:hypothetical protein
MMDAKSIREALLGDPTIKSGDEAERFFLLQEQFPDLIQQVALRIPCRSAQAPSPKLSLCASMWHKAGMHWDPFIDDQGGFIERVRGKIVWDFLNQDDLKGFKWLVMIDNDMEPDLDLIHRLCRWDEPVIAAPCMTMHVDFGPIINFTRQDEGGMYRFPALKALMRRGLRVPTNGIMEVGHVGTGAIAIRRDVLEAFTWKMPADGLLEFLKHQVADPNMSELEKSHLALRVSKLLAPDVPFMVPDYMRMEAATFGEIRVGEDIWFCNQVRRKGFKIYVECSAEVGHRKSLCLKLDEVFKDPELNPETWVLPMEGVVVTAE